MEDTNPNTMEIKPNTMMGNKSNTLQRLREIKFIPINVIVIFQQTISYDPLFESFELLKTFYSNPLWQPEAHQCNNY